MRMLGKPWEPQVIEWARAYHPLMPIGCPSGPLSYNRRQGWVASVRGDARRRMWRPWVGSGTDKPITVNSSYGSQSLINPCTVDPSMLSHLYGDDTARTLGLICRGTRGDRHSDRGLCQGPTHTGNPQCEGSQAEYYRL